MNLSNIYRYLLIFISVYVILTSSYLIITSRWTSLYNDSFNCDDMSYMLAPFFRKLGFDTIILWGKNKEDSNKSGHCWLSLNGIYFDAVALWFLSEDDYSVYRIDKYPYGQIINGFLDVYDPSQNVSAFLK